VSSMQETGPPLKALIWEDDSGKVWVSYNSTEKQPRQNSPRQSKSVYNLARSYNKTGNYY
jgi:uncharacterized protein (DUF302 family)